MSIQDDVIAGHEAAIAKLEQSIAERELLFRTVKFVEPSFRLAMNRIHLKEMEQLELLELELKGIKEQWV